MWRPELDIVRSSGLDDPGGGPFEGAEDQVIVTLRVPAAFRPAPRPEPAGETPLPPEDPVAPPG
jgi:hypothetical protein